MLHMSLFLQTAECKHGAFVEVNRSEYCAGFGRLLLVLKPERRETEPALVDGSPPGCALTRRHFSLSLGSEV